MTGVDFIDEAIPHEAGHIVVGWSLGLPVQRIDVEIFREGGQTRLGNFITVSMEPPDDLIPKTPPEVLTRLKLALGGGLAGNLFAGVSASEECLGDDRLKLQRYGTDTLEAMAQSAGKIIHEKRRIFRRLKSRIEAEFLSLMKDQTRGTGRHTLLNSGELTKIFEKS